jgi:hypothetical protein
MTPDDRKTKPCTLQEAQKRLAQYHARPGQGSSYGTTYIITNSSINGHERNQNPANGGVPGETPVDPTSTRDNGTGGPEKSTPQPPDAATPPSAGESVTPSSPDTHTDVDTSPDDVCETIDDVVIVLEKYLTNYVDVQAAHRFARFRIATKRVTANELHVIIEERT